MSPSSREHWVPVFALWANECPKWGWLRPEIQLFIDSSKSSPELLQTIWTSPNAWDYFRRSENCRPFVLTMRRLDARFLVTKDICIAVSKHLQLFAANVFGGRIKCILYLISSALFCLLPPNVITHAWGRFVATAKKVERSFIIGK